jgi:L-seryl-tRNA(Ser) seleniumtransferase
VTFSGDKLLGGPQAGIIVGRKRLVDRLRRHPLKRALRIDKLTLVALLEVLRLYRDPQRLPERLPTLRDLLRPLNEIESVALAVLAALKQAIGGEVKVALSPCKSQVGSGALPTDTIDSLAVSLEITGTGGDSGLQSLALAFRSLPRPVIGRISDGRLLFDMRCLRDVDSFIGQLGHLPRD